MKSQSFYNREKPLLERKHVPCELITPNDGKIGQEQQLSKRKVYFTLRVLQGHRVMPNNIGSSERSIRLELSDEHRKNGKQSNACARKKEQQQNSMHMSHLGSSSQWQFPSHGPIHFPVIQHLPAAEDENNHGCVEDDEILIDSSSTINLYELEVGESDFAKLRQDQALLVDFSAFSKSFIELLLSCDLGEDNETSGTIKRSGMPQQPPNPTPGCSGIHSPFNIDLSRSIAQGKPFGSQFTCRIEDFTSRGAKSLNGNKGCNNSHFARFSIVESNQFRELVHLSLNIHPGSDETVRTYLSARLNQILGQNAMIKFQLENEKHRANTNENACNDISRQYNEMVSISEKERNSLAQEAGESIQKESAKRLEELQIISRIKEEEIQRLKDSVGGQIKSLQKELEIMGNENKCLIEENEDKNAALANLERGLDKYESALESSRSDMDTVQRELRIVKSDRDEMEERLKESQLVGSKLKASNEEYESRITESQKELKMASTSAQDSQTEAETHLHQLRNTQGKLESTREELSKAKELLVRYQQDRQEMKRRMRSKVEMIQKQEEILSSREVRSTEVQEKFAEKENECLCLTKELSHAKERLSQTQQKLDENQRTIASNQQVSFPIQTIYKPYGHYNKLFSNLFVSFSPMLVFIMAVSNEGYCLAQ